MNETCQETRIRTTFSVLFGALKPQLVFSSTSDPCAPVELHPILTMVCWRLFSSTHQKQELVFFPRLLFSVRSYCYWCTYVSIVSSCR